MIFTFGSMLAGLIIFKLEFLIIILLDISANHLPIFLSGIVSLLEYFILIMVVITQLWSHFNMWKMAISNPEGSLYEGILWMLKEQWRLAKVVFSFGQKP